VLLSIPFDDLERQDDRVIATYLDLLDERADRG
jgi:hypothetical protein